MSAYDFNEKPYVRTFWCPVGSVLGIVSIPFIAYQITICPLAPSHAVTNLTLTAAVIASLALLWLHAILIFVSEAIDWLEPQSDTTIAHSELAESLSNGVIDSELSRYGQDARLTAEIDRRWKVARRIVWLRERGLVILYLAIVAAVSFWIIPACSRVCTTEPLVHVAIWCETAYRKVGPLGLLCMAAASTLARKEYPRPFRQLQLDYLHILEKKRQTAQMAKQGRPRA